ncbi:MAG: hypothetical protein CMM07_04825 [Rhodopirellula sp.]|nr:hypothetical protein [Rhodopirellula sp.]
MRFENAIGGIAIACIGLKCITVNFGKGSGRRSDLTESSVFAMPKPQAGAFKGMGDGNRLAAANCRVEGTTPFKLGCCFA